MRHNCIPAEELGGRHHFTNFLALALPNTNAGFSGRLPVACLLSFWAQREAREIKKGQTHKSEVRAPAIRTEITYPSKRRERVHNAVLSLSVPRSRFLQSQSPRSHLKTGRRETLVQKKGGKQKVCSLSLLVSRAQLSLLACCHWQVKRGKDEHAPLFYFTSCLCTPGTPPPSTSHFIIVLLAANYRPPPQPLSFPPPRRAGPRDKHAVYCSDSTQPIFLIPFTLSFLLHRNMPAAKEDYDVLEVIGQGSFGKVCRVRRNEDGKVCVCV